MKCQGGVKYVLPITVKFDQSTRRFGRISFAHLFKLTKHNILIVYLLSPHLLSCMRDSIYYKSRCTHSQRFIYNLCWLAKRFLRILTLSLNYKEWNAKSNVVLTLMHSKQENNVVSALALIRHCFSGSVPIWRTIIIMRHSKIRHCG